MAAAWLVVVAEAVVGHLGLLAYAVATNRRPCWPGPRRSMSMLAENTLVTPAVPLRQHAHLLPHLDRWVLHERMVLDQDPWRTAGRRPS